jgi:hypothetical protein
MTTSTPTSYPIAITDWLTSPRYCGSIFKGNTYDNWKTLIAGFYGETEDLDNPVFSQMTGRLIDSNFNELWVVGGRRSGKSHMASAIAVYEAFLGNHQRNLSKGEVATISLLASDRKQARTLMRYIKGIIDSIPPLKTLIKKESTDIIELHNGCAIEIQTASYRGVRGYTLACAILDEVAFWYDDGANPDKEILKAIKPSLSTLNGKLICLSSPYSKKGILWDAWRKYFSKHGTSVLVAKCPTPFMNPTITDSHLRQAREEDSISFKSEYMAEFRDDISSYVTEENLDKCIRQSPLENPYDREINYKAFVDASGGIGDAYTLVVGHQEGGLVIIDKVEVVHPPFSPEATTQFIAQICKHYNVYRVVGDRYAGNWVSNAFERAGVDYRVSEKVTTELYQDLIPVINSQRVELPPHDDLKKQLLNLERRTSRSGRMIISHPPNAHDDIANSVAGLVSLFLNRRIANINLSNIFPT